MTSSANQSWCKYDFDTQNPEITQYTNKNSLAGLDKLNRFFFLKVKISYELQGNIELKGKNVLWSKSKERKLISH